MARDDPRIDWGPGEWLAEVNRLKAHCEQVEAERDDAVLRASTWNTRAIKRKADLEAAEQQRDEAVAALERIAASPGGMKVVHTIARQTLERITDG